jgi:hypothetical protein
LRAAAAFALALSFMATAARAGPPYVTDDPETTSFQHYEIYLFGAGGTGPQSGTSGEGGIDFNYGGGRNLQLTAVVPLGFVVDPNGSSAVGYGRTELAAKYRFLHQDEIGFDIAVFPRVFLPSGASRLGDRHASYLLPLWLEKDWEGWSAFGGGGCEINRGGGAQDFCLLGGVVTHQLRPDLQLGLELVHQSADTKGGKASTALGLGITYELSETYHLLAYANRGLQHAAENTTYSWYAAILFTF